MLRRVRSRGLYLRVSRILAVHAILRVWVSVCMEGKERRGGGSGREEEERDVRLVCQSCGCSQAGHRSSFIGVDLQSDRVMQSTSGRQYRDIKGKERNGSR